MSSNDHTRALLFDFDDCLCNSAPLHIEATRIAFAEYGITYELTDELKPLLYGRRIPDVMDIIFAQYNVALDKVAFMHRRRTEFIRLVHECLQPMRGFADLIALTRQLPLPCALASSGEREYLDAGIHKLGLHDFFATIVSGDDVHEGKPNPAIFLLAAAQLKVPPEHCVVIEDSQAGVEAARRANMCVIGVRNPHAPVPQDLSDATVMVDHLGCITRAMLE